MKTGRKIAEQDISSSLQKKATTSSVEAILVSVVVHVLIIAFAGSVVAYEYIKRKDAAFEGKNIERPKMERRKLQMPVKLKKMQKKSRRPKVNARMTTASTPSLNLPDMSSLVSKGGDAFGMAGMGGDGGGGNGLSGMGAAGSLGFGITTIDFFGAKSKGEKIVFIIDAGKAMMEDSKGGYYTYKFAKDKIFRLIERMRGVTLCNVMVYSGDNYGTHSSALFASNLIPATVENKEALRKWIDPINSNPRTVGNIQELENYIPSIEYNSEVGINAFAWLNPLQAAMEQKADNIFILVSGWGEHVREIDTDALQTWRTERGWPPSRMEKRQEIKDERDRLAREILEKENKARKRRGRPERIVANFWDYKREIKSKLPPEPELPPTPEDLSYRYDVDDIVEHLDAVYEYHYKPNKLGKPKIHFVELIAADSAEKGSAGVKNLQEVCREFNGEFEFLEGSGTIRDVIK